MSLHTFAFDLTNSGVKQTGCTRGAPEDPPDLTLYLAAVGFFLTALQPFGPPPDGSKWMFDRRHDVLVANCERYLALFVDATADDSSSLTTGQPSRTINAGRASNCGLLGNLLGHSHDDASPD